MSLPKLSPHPGLIEAISNTVQEIERAIAAPTPSSLRNYTQGLINTTHRPSTLTFDLAAGRLDNAVARAFDDEKHGRTEPL